MSEDEKQRLLTRVRGKLIRKWENQKFDVLEVLGIQLETEAAELVDWRKNGERNELN